MKLMHPVVQLVTTIIAIAVAYSMKLYEACVLYKINSGDRGKVYMVKAN